MVKIVRRVSLANLGDNFKDSFIDLNEMSIRQSIGVQKDPSTVLDYISKEFVGGQIWDGEKNVELTSADDVLELPMSVLMSITNFFLTQVSTTTSA